MDLWRTSVFSTKAMYCVDCKKKVQVDTSKRSQCPDCLSFKVTEASQQARSRSQAPTHVAARGKRTVAGPGQRVNIQQRRSGEGRPGQTVPQRPAVRTGIRREQREEAKHVPAVNLRSKVQHSLNQRRAPPVPHQPQPRVPRPEQRRALPVVREEPQLPEEYYRPRPLVRDSDSDEEPHRDLLAPLGGVRRVRLIRISSPLEALELFHFLPQRQAAVLYFIMHGLGLFGIPQYEYGLGGSFEDFLASIVSAQPESVHPASQDYLERMETAKVSRDMEKKGDVCTICLAAFKAGEYANRLPCKHVFHGECVVPWLRTNNTCPVCRQVVDS